MNKNCWDIKNCGLESCKKKGGQSCPAAASKEFDTINNGTNAGRCCWIVSGTFCRGEKQGQYAKKIHSCLQCTFLHKVMEEEGEQFDTGIDALMKLFDEEGVKPLLKSAYQQLFKISYDLYKSQTMIIHNERLAGLGKLVGEIIHEINSPLSIIKLSTTVLDKKVQAGVLENEEAIKRFAIINKAIRRITNTIENMRNKVRVSEGAPLELVNFKDILNNINNFCNECFDLSTIDLSINLKEDIYINCREIEIEQVIINLIKNAMDSISNLDKKWIKIDYRKDDKFLNIFATDSGPGIPETLQKKIFEPFFSSKGKNGTGLGLSICLDIIKFHGGNLFIDDQSKNTRFVIQIPYV